MKLLPGALCLAIAATPAGAAAPSIDSIAGLYVRNQSIPFATGLSERVDDVLEIVKVDQKSAYVRARLWFNNGHLCGVSGIADWESGALTYRPADQELRERKCVLRLAVKGSRVIFSDPDYGCKYQMCGARGAFEGVSFPLSARRPIRYMDRLLKSREYNEAIEERKRAGR